MHGNLSLRLVNKMPKSNADITFHNIISHNVLTQCILIHFYPQTHLITCMTFCDTCILYLLLLRCTCTSITFMLKLIEIQCVQGSDQGYTTHSSPKNDEYLEIKLPQV